MQSASDVQFEEVFPLVTLPLLFDMHLEHADVTAVRQLDIPRCLSV